MKQLKDKIYCVVTERRWKPECVELVTLDKEEALTVSNSHHADNHYVRIDVWENGKLLEEDDKNECVISIGST